MATFPDPAQASNDELAIALESWIPLAEMTRDRAADDDRALFLHLMVAAVWEVLNGEVKRRNNAWISEHGTPSDEEIGRFLDGGSV